MERFIDKLRIITYNNICNLKSSMERFIAVNNDIARTNSVVFKIQYGEIYSLTKIDSPTRFRYLKSSMERFIVAVFCIFPIDFSKFKIQYGEIYSIISSLALISI